MIDDQSVRHFIDGEYIRDWLILGPFFPDALDKDFLADAGGEANIEPKEGDVVTTTDGRTLTWKYYEAKGNVVDLLDAIGKHEYATAYAFCVLQSESADDAEFYTGKDDCIAVWMNGKRVYHNPLPESIHVDKYVFEADLKSGANRCLVKISNRASQWCFTLRATILPSHRAVLSGLITGERSHSIPDAHVWLERDGERAAETQTDVSGRYRLNVHPVCGSYSLSVVSGELGGWQSGIRLSEGERRTLNVTLKEAISMEGTLLMLDGKTPHAAIPVQVISDGKVIDTVLSDESGRYRFVNLKQGGYKVRCQVLGGYIYHGEEKSVKPEGQKAGGRGSEEAGERGNGDVLRVESGRTVRGIDFRFADFKRGVWKRHTYLDGLAHNVVHDIHRSPDGTMWFATEGGVSRYDGKEFVNFTTKDGLAANWVWTIHCDPDGVLWFGTRQGGVSRYDGKEFVNFTTKDGLVGNWVNAIYRDSNGNMWFGTHGAGVSRYDGKEFVNFTIKDGLAHGIIPSINAGPNGTVWFGTGDGGLSCYDGKGFVNLTTKDGLVNNNVLVIHCDPDGTIWFGTSGGVSRYDGRNTGNSPHFANFTTEDGLADNVVNAICRDPDGTMWFGTRGGVSRYDVKNIGSSPHFVNFTAEDGLADNVVNAIYRDPDGTMWFGTQGGVSRYDGEDFVNFTIRDGLAGKQVTAMDCDPDGVMWIGTEGGVSRHHGKGMRNFSHFVNFTSETGLAGKRISAISCGADGVLWFATAQHIGWSKWYGVISGGDTFRYDGRELINFTTKDGLMNNNVLALYSGPDGITWFGTRGGIFRYSARGGGDFPHIVNFTQKDGLPSVTVSAICRAADGVMWFGMHTGGVSRYDGKEFISFSTNDGLAGNFVNVIHSDPDGVVWFGTLDGISRYDGKEFISYTAEDGLANDKILTIHRDTHGALWVGTEGGGVSCYDGTAWSSLDTRDGLVGDDVGSILQDSDGALLFGTDGGITRYRRSATTPRVYIVSVTTDQTYRDISDIPALISGVRVTIKYSSVDFKTVPEKRQYRCRVYETSESRLKSQASGLPYNLPTRDTTFDWIPEKPGTYVFEVQSIGRDLNYSEPATLSLTVQPDPTLVAMQMELDDLRQVASRKYHFSSFIGESAAIRQVHALMERAIDSGLTVLITGETGTGKELVARAIHHNSPRKDKPLLDRNCGAIPRELLTSELFGHRKGAFTGANEDKMGLFEAASGGTVQLDEIGEMPQDAQIHLLRFLEEREIQRLGENISRHIDVRIIATTNRDLAEEVTAGRFREDLYYRLSEFPIHIPSLRERPEDIPLLAEHFLKDIDKEVYGFAPGVLEMLQGYSWPGNVRELRNVIRRAAALAEEGVQIQTYHFPPEITQGESLVQEIMSEQTGLSASVENFKRRMVESALRKCNGNRTHAAEILGIARPNLIKLIKRLGIDL